MTILAYTDGASRGNPGESGIGVILKDESGNLLAEHYGYIGSLRVSSLWRKWDAGISSCIPIAS
jgi:ribonuclease HI